MKGPIVSKYTNTRQYQTDTILKFIFKKIKNKTDSTVSQVLVLRPVNLAKKGLKAVLQSRIYFFRLRLRGVVNPNYGSGSSSGSATLVKSAAKLRVSVPSASCAWLRLYSAFGSFGL
jgi:hypothetical protein